MAFEELLVHRFYDAWEHQPAGTSVPTQQGEPEDHSGPDWAHSHYFCARGLVSGSCCSLDTSLRSSTTSHGGNSSYVQRAPSWSRSRHTGQMRDGAWHWRCAKESIQAALAKDPPAACKNKPQPPRSTPARNQPWSQQRGNYQGQKRPQWESGRPRRSTTRATATGMIRARSLPVELAGPATPARDSPGHRRMTVYPAKRGVPTRQTDRPMVRQRGHHPLVGLRWHGVCTLSTGAS